MPLCYTGTFSRDLPGALRRAAVPADFVDVVEDLPQQPHRDQRASHQPSGTYRLLGVRHGRELRLVAATLRIDGKEQRLYRTSVAGQEQWVNDDGQILSGTSVTKPVAGGRMTSPFGWRIHPVLGDRRFHYGVDFALPKGSPVYADDDGVVTEIGHHGNYGKLVRIRHPHGAESVYAHLDGYSKGLKQGSHVKRGQTVAYVGQSGLATGPHLYWETVQNDEYVDPLRLLAESKKLSAHQMAELRKAAAALEKEATPAAVTVAAAHKRGNHQ